MVQSPATAPFRFAQGDEARVWVEPTTQIPVRVLLGVVIVAEMSGQPGAFLRTAVPRPVHESNSAAVPELPLRPTAMNGTELPAATTWYKSARSAIP
jgi:hypothetical protein